MSNAEILSAVEQAILNEDGSINKEGLVNLLANYIEEVNEILEGICEELDEIRQFVGLPPVEDDLE